MTRIVLRPNASISRRGLWWCAGGLALVGGGIAGGFAWLGYWLVLPFTGLELAVLALVCRCCLRRAETQEVVTIDGDLVRVEAGRSGPECSCVFPRQWTQVLLQGAPLRGHPSRLLLRSAGRQVEVGAFLTEEERRQLWCALRGCIG